jgi:antitoxin component YwqK of YwqJK toxin-antitoxin module
VIEDGMGVTTGELKLFENLEKGSDFISIKVPINLDGSISYTLPVEAGREDYVLTWQEGNMMQWKDINSLLVGDARENIQVVVPPKEILEEQKEEVKEAITPINNTCSNVICAVTTDIDLQASVIGILPLENGGTGSSLEDPGEDRILFWDESLGKLRWLKIGDNLEVDDRTLNAENSGDEEDDNSEVVVPPSSGYTGEIYTAGNGLLVSGSTVELGGSLTKNTTIFQGDMNMIFNLTGAGDFDIQDSGVSSLYVSGSSGNVGIGTTNPDEQLDVVGGNIRTDSDLIASGAVFGYAIGSGVTDRVGGAAKFMTGEGYLYFDRNNSEVKMDETTGNLSGHAFSDDLGWIDFGEDENPSGPVNVNLTSGSVTGKAYVISSGSYVDFTNYSSNVSVNLSTGVFSGYAWSEEAGWIDFSDSGVYFSNSTITTYAADQNLYINPEGDGVTFISGNVTIDGTAYAQALDIAGNIELNEYLYFGNGSTEYLRWDGSDFTLSDDLLPSSSATHNLGSDPYRWGDLYLDGATLHIGSSTASEGLISYASNVLGFETSSTAVDIAFFTDDLYIDKSLGYIGIGTTAPDYELDALGTIQAYNFVTSGGMPVNDILLEQEVRNLSITAMKGSLGLDMTQFVEKVSETTFNAGDTYSSSGNVSIAHFPNGNILIAYQDVGDSYYGNFVIYDSAGNLVKSETTFKAALISWPSTTTLQNGNILITYGVNFPSKDNFVIYDSAGNEVVSETTYNEGGTQHPSATTLTNGNILIAYRDLGDSSYGKFVIYDSAGNLVKAETTFSATTSIPSVATLTNGNVLIAYNANSNGYFIILDSAGKEIVSETIFNVGSVYTPSLKIFNNGNILIAYRDGGGSSYGNFVIYDSAGNLVKAETTFNSGTTTALSTTNLTNGNILIAYQDWSSSSGNFVIYDSAGNLVKSETTFHASSIGNYLSATTLTNGNVLIAYIDSGDSNYGKFVIWGSSGASFANMVGIGTTAPAYKLDVQDTQASSYVSRIQNLSTSTTADGLLIALGVGTTRGTGNVYVGFAYNNTTVAGRIIGNGTAVAYETTGADYAEYFLAEDFTSKPEPGDIVSLSQIKSKAVTKAVSPSKAIGVISDSAGFVGNAPICEVADQDCDTNYEKTNVVVGITGQLSVKVSTKNGAINLGDPLTTSDIPGVAVKATKAGNIIGHAMESYSEPDPDTIKRIRVYLNSTWFDPGSLLAISDSGELEGDNITSEPSILTEEPQNIGNYDLLTSSSISTVSLKTKELTIDGVNLDDYIKNVLSDAGLDSVSESTESSESVPTTDSAGILAEMQTIFEEFKEMILTLGMTSQTDESGNNYLSIDSDVKMSGDLNVLGETTTSNLTVTGNIQVGMLEIDTVENSINVLGVSCFNPETNETNQECLEMTDQTLYLQKTSSGNLDVFNGKLVIEPNGTMRLDGSLEVTGTVNSKSVNTETVSTEKIILKNTFIEESETPSGEVISEPQAEESVDLTEPCEKGEIKWDDNNIYVCTSSETWRVSPLNDIE